MSRFVIFLISLSVALTIGAAPRAEDAKPGAEAAAFKEKVEVCAGCHGAAGIAQADGVPNLAGQPDLFLQWQLIYFRGETRLNEQMTPQAKDLTDSDVRDLSAYFGQCHAQTFVGQGEIPRLAGQREEFIVKALHDYQHGARRGRGNVIMPEIAYSLNEDDIKALAHFMSRQSGK